MNYIFTVQNGEESHDYVDMDETEQEQLRESLSDRIAKSIAQIMARS